VYTASFASDSLGVQLYTAVFTMPFLYLSTFALQKKSASQKTRMSFGTVYRNLQILEEEGEIISVQTDPAVLRYDRKRVRHYHLRCKKCGRVFDIPIPYRKDFDRKAGGKSGFVIESHTVSFEGLCLDCKRTVE
jgi:Fe2+ or Zn2+ uptake regulation protein